MVSSWKLDNSSTYKSASCSSKSRAGTPILPPTPTVKPAAFAITPVKSVTVLLPLEPVIAITGLSTAHAKSSISPTTGVPFARTACTSGVAKAIPGLVTTKSASASHSVFQAQLCSSTCSGKRSAPGGVARVSMTLTVSCGCVFVRCLTTESPVIPSPTTTTLCMFCQRSIFDHAICLVLGRCD